MSGMAPPVCEIAKDHWQTPSWIIGLLSGVGKLKLDPCSADGNPTSADVFYTLRNPAPPPSEWPACNGSDFCFVNWPYSSNSEWSESVIEYASATGSNVVALAPTSTGTRWFSCLSKISTRTILLDKRVQFFDPVAMEIRRANTLGSAIFVIGSDEFCNGVSKVFKDHGTVFVSVENVAEVAR